MMWICVSILCMGIFFFQEIDGAQPLNQSSEMVGREALSDKKSTEIVSSDESSPGFFKRIWHRFRGKPQHGKMPVAAPRPRDPGAIIDDEQRTYQWIRTFGEVLGMAKNRGWRPVDTEKLIQDALRFGISRIDTHSSFFTPDHFNAARESASGEFSGVGVSIVGKTLEDDVLVIVDVVDGGPAYKAGMRAGDKITEIDGEKLKGLSSDEAINKLKGKIKTDVAVKYIRNKKPCEAVITRDIIKDQHSVGYCFKDSSIYYLSLKLFADNAAAQMASIIKKADRGECKGLVLDLRRNPGGVLDSAIEMAGIFLDNKSLVVSTKKRDGSVVAQYHTTTEPLLKSDLPIIVLIDNFTASAAEILAGVLQYYSVQSYASNGQNSHRKLMVFLVGTESFGKGSVQEVIPVSNGCALKLTTMLYYLPGDTSIQAVGIKPDVVVKPKFIPTDEMKWVVEMYGKESSFKGHITTAEVKAVGTGTTPPAPEKDLTSSGDKKKDEDDGKSWEDRHKEAILGDNQVQAAVNMLNLLIVAREHAPRLVKTRDRALEYIKKHFVVDDGAVLEKII